MISSDKIPRITATTIRSVSEFSRKHKAAMVTAGMKKYKDDFSFTSMSKGSVPGTGNLRPINCGKMTRHSATNDD